MLVLTVHFLSQKTLFCIKAGAAADLRQFSAFPGEDELLMFPSTVLRVLNVKRLSRSVVCFWRYFTVWCTHKSP